MKYDKIIEGKNIILRNIELTDCNENYARWLNDNEVNKYLESRVHCPHTLETITNYVNGVHNSHDSYLFAIIHKKTGNHIGNIGLNCHPFHKNAIIGYLIGEKEYWGKGYASEAVFLVCNFGFHILNLHKIKTHVFLPNIGSSRMLEKLGFKNTARLTEDVLVDGEYIDTYLYEVFANDITLPPNREFD